MSFFNNPPIRNASISKKTVDQPYGSVFRCSPPSLKQARIMEDRYTARLHETAPVIPVAFHAWLGVIAIDQKQINRFQPSLDRVLAEFFYPNHFPAAIALDSSSRSALQEVKSGISAEMEWVNQV